MSLCPRPSRHAFSLVELSIVLVILGLLVGGILAGQSLIRAAELRAVSSEFARYTAAVYAFRDKYFALPGDVTNATKLWGQSADCPGAHDEGTSLTTCDGNGDGRVYFTGSYASPTANEVFRFWQHLANAGLIEGQYDGVTASPSGYFLGVGPSNSPASRMATGFWSTTSADNRNGGYSGRAFRHDFHPSFLLGGFLDSESANDGLIFLPEEAWNIDTKLDDGKPGRGKVTSAVGNLCTDAATNAALDAAFLLTEKTKTCYLRFIY